MVMLFTLQHFGRYWAQSSRTPQPQPMPNVPGDQRHGKAPHSFGIDHSCRSSRQADRSRPSGRSSELRSVGVHPGYCKSSSTSFALSHPRNFSWNEGAARWLEPTTGISATSSTSGIPPATPAIFSLTVEISAAMPPAVVPFSP
jgi:hypothetical protein